MSNNLLNQQDMNPKQIQEDNPKQYSQRSQDFWRPGTY